MARTIQSAAVMSRSTKPPTPIHSLIATLSGPFDPQSSCVLFSGIPPEIRNRILSFTLYSYDDESRPYPENSYYSRSSYRYHQRISTNILATCRRIYSEAHDLPVSQNEHVFWCPCARCPDRNFRDNPTWYFYKLTIEQKAAVVRVHLFTQLQWLESRKFKTFCTLEDAHPQHLEITVRHTDWRDWEFNAPLTMKCNWVDNLKLMKRLEIFEVELEAMERDKSQLESIVKILADMKIELGGLQQQYIPENAVITTQRYKAQSVYVDQSLDLAESTLYYSMNSNYWKQEEPEQADPIPYILMTICI